MLLVEDDHLLGKAMQAGLVQHGHAVDWLRDGASAIHAVLDGNYEAVLLDLGLPQQDGLTVLRRIRAGGYHGPVLIVTARDEIQDRVVGLDSGADDFIVKPFDMDELAARLRAAARRAAGRSEPRLICGDLVVDPAARRVVQRGELVPLTTREYALLVHLLEHQGHVRSRGQLQEALYNWERDIESNAVEVHIHNLRRKLGRNLIRTVHGQGYSIDSGPIATT
jgi:two-component system OmpR family response regulator/two-component system response regulator QseB